SLSLYSTGSSLIAACAAPSDSDSAAATIQLCIIVLLPWCPCWPLMCPAGCVLPIWMSNGRETAVRQGGPCRIAMLEPAHPHPPDLHLASVVLQRDDTR